MKTLKFLLAAFAIVIAARPARMDVRIPQAEVNAYANSFASDSDDKKESKADKEESLYAAASDMLDEHEWRKAAATFDRVVQMGGAHADAALYWKAHAQNQMGQRAEALDTLVT